VQNCDSESADSSLVAVDYRTGDTVWTTPRTVIRGWSTPSLIRTTGREELILNSHAGVRSYDPKTGRELWWCQGFNGRGEGFGDFDRKLADPAGVHLIRQFRGEPPGAAQETFRRRVHRCAERPESIARRT
jgi:outer membrane protein assembly factor BamB